MARGIGGFLGLIAFSTVVDFLVGLRIDEADEKRTKKAWLWVSLSLLCAGFISFTGFGMQAMISATSSTVVNHINKVNSFIFAHMIFQDKINPLMIVGMLITMAGTIWYSVERLNERKAEAAAKASPAAASTEKTPLQPDKSKATV